MVFTPRESRVSGSSAQKLWGLLLVVCVAIFWGPTVSTSCFLLVAHPAHQHHAVANNNHRRLEASKEEPLPTRIHHAALKTRNITTAIQFYSLLGFSVQHKFRAGPARAAWLQLPSAKTEPASSRLELIEVPGYMLQEEPGTRKRALDLMKRPEFLGWNHVALDVTDQVVSMNEQDPNNGTLYGYMQLLNATSWDTFGRTLPVALEPQQKMIGNEVYELGFLYDADGCLIELLHKQAELSQQINSGWEPWDGTGFVGGLPSIL